MKHIYFITINILCCVMLFSCSILFGPLIGTDSDSSSSSSSSTTVKNGGSSTSTTLTTLAPQDSLNETFESGTLTANSWVLGGNCEPEIIDAEDYPDYVYDGNYAVKLSADYHDSSILAINLRLTEPQIFSFMYKTDISSSENCIETFKCSINDTIVASPTGLNKPYGKYSTKLDPGTYLIVFKTRNDTNYHYTNYTNAVYLDNIMLYDVPTPRTLFCDTFDNGINENYWTLSASVSVDKDDAIAGFIETSHTGVLNDNHGKVLRFDMNIMGTATLSMIDLSSDATLTFDYKSQCHELNALSIIIDDITADTLSVGAYRWRKHAIPLTAGSHTIIFTAVKNTMLWWPSRTDAIYIDNVSIVTDNIVSIDITPRGTQQTYIGGHTIQYSANALRSDKSVIAGKSVSWSVSGGGNITSDGLFTPTTAGTFTVTAAIGDKTNTSTIVVHQSNTSDSITIGETTFTGVDDSSITGSALSDTSYIDFDTTKMPSKTTFSADGYFPLVGKLKSGSYNIVYIDVSKDEYRTSYILQGDFDQRIWLRFGQGEYSIKIFEYNASFRTDISNNHGALYQYNSYGQGRELTVTNTNTMSAEDAMFLMPSHYVNHDDYSIQNIVADVTSQLPNEATTADKLRALHDWETDYLYYDYGSIGDYSDNRRHQESIWVLDNKTAVCEGYANLYAALARQIGVKVQYISSSIMNHGWNKTFFDEDWHLTDVTWDDPTTEPHDKTNTNPLPYREDYSYFIIDTNEGHEKGTDAEADLGRGSTVPPRMLGEIITGWF